MPTAAKIALVIVAGVAALAVAGYVVLRVLGASVADQAALTSEVAVEVIQVEDAEWGTGATQYQGHAITYTYTAGGQRWRDETRLTDQEWSAGSPLTACVDPGDASHHALRLFDEECGGVVSGGSTHADPA